MTNLLTGSELILRIGIFLKRNRRNRVNANKMNGQTGSFHSPPGREQMLPKWTGKEPPIVLPKVEFNLLVNNSARLLNGFFKSAT